MLGSDPRREGGSIASARKETAKRVLQRGWPGVHHHEPELRYPYINYLTNGRYCSFITHTGGGYSFWKQAPAYGINLWAPALDNGPGRFVYIKEGDEIWTPNWLPTRTELDSWQCRVGLGYQRLEAKKDGLTAWLSYLVPLDADIEYWILHFINESDRRRSFEAYPFVELLLGQHMPNIISYYSNILFNRVYESDGMLVAEKTYWNREAYAPNRPWPIKVFFASTREPDSYETLRDEFIGPGQGTARPRGVVEGTSQTARTTGARPFSPTSTPSSSTRAPKSGSSSRWGSSNATRTSTWSPTI